MILTPEERIAKSVEAGAWTRVTVDQMFRKGLSAHPDRVAFRDVGEGSIPGVAATFTYAEADRRIEGLAAFFAGIGLKPDMVIGVHLPPCADGALIVLAALRAGLVVCGLPVHWTQLEIQAAIDAGAIKAIVTAAEIEGDASGERVRDVAAETFAIRFVFAVGVGLPDGLIDLAEVLRDVESLGPAPEVSRRGAAADHVALLSIARAPDDRLLMVPFSHNHLVASALAHLLEAGLDRDPVLLSTMHPASVAGFAGSIVTGLMGGGTVAFHHATSLHGLREAAVAAGATRIILPSPFGAALATITEPDLAFSLVSTGLDATPLKAIVGSRRVVDLYTFGGLCLIPSARSADGTQTPLPHGPMRLPRGIDTGPVLYETRVKPRVKAGERRAMVNAGELHLSGAIIPDAPWPEPASGGSGAMLGFTSDAQLRTGLLAEALDEKIRIRGPIAESLIIGGRTLSPSRLDALFRTHPDVLDAAVFPIGSEADGIRLGLAVVPRMGQPLNLDDFLTWLDDQQAGSLDKPASLVSVREIPRSADGAVLRASLFRRAAA